VEPDIPEQRWGSTPKQDLPLRWNPAGGPNQAAWRPGGVAGGDSKRVLVWVGSQTLEVWEWVLARVEQYRAAYPGHPASRYHAEAGLDLICWQRRVTAGAALAWLADWMECTCIP
jgi:hypothetical protein